MCTRSTKAEARSGSPACAGSMPVGHVDGELAVAQRLLLEHFFVLVEEREQRAALGLVRLAREQDLVEPVEARRVVAARFANHAARERLRRFEHDVAVVQRQRLQRRRRHVALAVHLLRGRHVERLEHRVGDAAPREDVEAAAVVVLRAASTCSSDCPRSSCRAPAGTRSGRRASCRAGRPRRAASRGSARRRGAGAGTSRAACSRDRPRTRRRDAPTIAGRRCDSRISRCSAFTLQPLATNCSAR